MGTKKRPFYRIVATDSRNRRDGRFIEELGYYDPLTNPPNVKVKEELFFKWMGHGAVPSENVESLMRRTGVMKKWMLVKQGVPAEQLDEKLEALKATETQGMGPDERRRRASAKKMSKKATAAAAEAAKSAPAAEPAPAAEAAE
jgi:small subunit ribosomal protein S16